MWNAGTGEPDAWTGKFSNGHPSIGVNKQYGVPFNVPAYASKVQNYAKNFYNTDFAGQVSGGDQTNPSPTTNVGMSTPSIPTTPKVSTTPQSGGGKMGQLLQSLATSPV